VKVPPANRRERATVLCAPAAAAIQAAELLGVERDELTGLAHVEATDAARRLWKDVRETFDVMTAQDPMDRACVHAQRARDAVGSPALVEPEARARWPRVRRGFAAESDADGELRSTYTPARRRQRYTVRRLAPTWRAATLTPMRMDSWTKNSRVRGDSREVPYTEALRLWVLAEHRHPSRRALFVTQVCGDLS
jgi:hypothetical protein